MAFLGGMKGTIVGFDPATTLGDIQLENASTVRFGFDQCTGFRSGLPAVGMPVQVSEVTKGWDGRPRAASVSPAALEAWDRTVLVHGLERERLAQDDAGRCIRLCPLDTAAFFATHSSWTDEARLRRHALGRAVACASPPSRTHPPIFTPWLELIERTRLEVAVLEGVDTTPGQGASFIGSEFADLPDSEWPRLRGRRMRHLAQLGAELMRSFGLDRQLNVFLSSFSSDDATVKVVATTPSQERTPAVKPAIATRALRVKGWASAYPSCLTLSRIGHAASDAFFDLHVDAAEPAPLPVSVQGLYEREFPPARRLGEALVVGGHGEAFTPEGALPFRRLLTIDTRALPQLKRLRRLREGDSASLAIDYEPESGASWMY